MPLPMKIAATNKAPVAAPTLARYVVSISGPLQHRRVRPASPQPPRPSVPTSWVPSPDLSRRSCESTEWVDPPSFSLLQDNVLNRRPWRPRDDPPDRRQEDVA